MRRIGYRQAGTRSSAGTEPRTEMVTSPVTADGYTRRENLVTAR